MISKASTTAEVIQSTASLPSEDSITTEVIQSTASPPSEDSTTAEVVKSTSSPLIITKITDISTTGKRMNFNKKDTITRINI